MFQSLASTSSGNPTLRRMPLGETHQTPRCPVSSPRNLILSSLCNKMIFIYCLQKENTEMEQPLEILMFQPSSYSHQFIMCVMLLWKTHVLMKNNWSSKVCETELIVDIVLITIILYPHTTFSKMISVIVPFFYISVIECNTGLTSKKLDAMKLSLDMCFFLF